MNLGVLRTTYDEGRHSVKMYAHIVCILCAQHIQSCTRRRSSPIPYLTKESNDGGVR